MCKLHELSNLSFSFTCTPTWAEPSQRLPKNSRTTPRSFLDQWHPNHSKKCWIFHFPCECRNVQSKYSRTVLSQTWLSQTLDSLQLESVPLGYSFSVTYLGLTVQVGGVDMGVARIFQRGGHTESYRGYSPDCHLNIVGCLQKGLQGGVGGGVTYTPGPPWPPWLHPWLNCS